MPAAVIAAAIGGAASVGTAVVGSRASDRSSRRAIDANAIATREAREVEERRINAERERNDELDRQAQARWEAEQTMAQRMWDAQEEERLFRRSIFEQDRQRELDAEAARNAYVPEDYGPSPEDPRIAQRRALQQNALGTLGQLLSQSTPGYVPATSPIVGPVGGRR